VHLISDDGRGAANAIHKAVADHLEHHAAVGPQVCQRVRTVIEAEADRLVVDGDDGVHHHRVGIAVLVDRRAGDETSPAKVRDEIGGHLRLRAAAAHVAIASASWGRAFWLKAWPSRLLSAPPALPSVLPSSAQGSR